MPGELEFADEELRALIDKQQISELLYRYCRAVDRIDPELGYTVFHDGAEADYGSIFQGSGHGVVDFICRSHRLGVVHSHQITNIIIELDGDRAVSEAYITSGMIMMEGEVPKQVTTRGRYLDRWSRLERRWGIEKRFYAGDINEIRTLTLGSVVPRFKLDRTDPSYALFAGTL